MFEEIQMRLSLIPPFYVLFDRIIHSGQYFQSQNINLRVTEQKKRDGSSLVFIGKSISNSILAIQSCIYRWSTFLCYFYGF